MSSGFMVEHDYGNADRVLKLTKAGFSDETIASVIRKDIRTAFESRPAPVQRRRLPVQAVAQPPAVEEKALMCRPPAAVRIEEYRAR